jgi:hypothetical protein
MNLKPKLIALSYLIGIGMLSTQVVKAQSGAAVMFQVSTNSDFDRNAENESITSVTSMKYSFPVLPTALIEHTALNQTLKTKEFYLHRARNQKTAAWILLVGGTAMATGGYFVAANNFYLFNFNNADTSSEDLFLNISAAGILLGIVADLVSIPFFISAHHNKKLASNISLGNQNSYLPLINSNSLSAIPTLTFKIRF